MTETERTYRTDGGDRAALPDLPVSTIRALPARVRSVTTTDEGKLKITLEGEIADNEALEKIRDLLLIQQGQVLIDVTGTQGELPV